MPLNMETKPTLGDKFVIFKGHYLKLTFYT